MWLDLREGLVQVRSLIVYFLLSMHMLLVSPEGMLPAGTYLFLDADIEKTVDYIKECAKRARSNWRDATRIRVYLAGAIDRFLPKDIDAGKVNASAASRLVLH